MTVARSASDVRSGPTAIDRLPRFLPGVEGLRAVAVFGVLGFHADIPLFTLGWAGVELFFVISGFLITGILLDSRQDAHYFRNFYARRALRIFPAYYLTFVCVVLAALVLHSNVGQWPWYVVYLQNYLMGVTSFKQHFPWAMDHTWSLAIEEQFYLILPFLVLVLPRRWLLRVSLCTIALAPLFRYGVLILTGNHNLTFTPLPAQADALAAGAVLAIVFRSSVSFRGLRITLAALVLAGSVATSFLVAFFYSSPGGVIWLARGPNVLLPSALALLFAGLVGSAAIGVRRVDRILVNQPVRYLGRISYGLYLYHLPVYWLLPLFWHHLPWPSWASLTRPVQVGLLFGCTILAAALSWRFVEMPCLRLKSRFRTPAQGQTVRAGLPIESDDSSRLTPGPGNLRASGDQA